MLPTASREPSRFVRSFSCHFSPTPLHSAITAWVDFPATVLCCRWPRRVSLAASARCHLLRFLMSPRCHWFHVFRLLRLPEFAFPPISTARFIALVSTTPPCRTCSTYFGCCAPSRFCYTCLDLVRLLCVCPLRISGSTQNYSDCCLPAIVLWCSLPRIFRAAIYGRPPICHCSACTCTVVARPAISAVFGLSSHLSRLGRCVFAMLNRTVCCFCPHLFSGTRFSNCDPPLLGIGPYPHLVRLLCPSHLPPVSLPLSGTLVPNVLIKTPLSNSGRRSCIHVSATARLCFRFQAASPTPALRFYVSLLRHRRLTSEDCLKILAETPCSQPVCFSPPRLSKALAT